MISSSNQRLSLSIKIDKIENQQADQPLRITTTKRSFTLLEIMVAILLLAIASGIVGVKMNGAVKKKQFHSQLERFEAQLLLSQKLAMAMQADWKGVLKKQGKEWTYSTICEDQVVRHLSPLHFSSMEIYFEGKKVDELTIDFFASGQVLPEGIFVFSSDEERIRWKLADLFQRQTGTKSGPVHPRD